MGINQRLDALISLVHSSMAESPLEVELQKINKEIRVRRGEIPSIQTQRNEVVHAYWQRGIMPERAIFLRFSAKGRLKVMYEFKTAGEIDAIAERIAQIVEKLDSWQYRFLASMAALEIDADDAR
jgi:hypothetical protein